MRLHAIVAAVVVSLPASAFAQPADTHAIAEEQFRQGREAMTQGDYKRALQLFRTSHGLEPGRGKLLNAALCEEQLGLLASALKHFREVEPQFPEGDERAPIVKQHLDAVGPRVPYLKIQLAPPAPARTTVTLDGEPLSPASLGVNIPVDSGRHVVTATASGATETRYELMVASAEHRALDVAPQVAVLEPSDRAPDPPQPRGAAWTLGVAALGVGGASVLAGAATGAAAAAKRASTVKLCPRGPALCPASEQPDIDAYNRLGAASTATFILGGALAAAGVTLVVISRRGDKPATGAWIAPVLGLGMVGAQGRF